MKIFVFYVKSAQHISCTVIVDTYSKDTIPVRPICNGEWMINNTTSASVPVFIYS